MEKLKGLANTPTAVILAFLVGGGSGSVMSAGGANELPRENRHEIMELRKEFYSSIIRVEKAISELTGYIDKTKGE